MKNYHFLIILTIISFFSANCMIKKITNNNESLNTFGSNYFFLNLQDKKPKNLNFSLYITNYEKKTTSLQSNTNFETKKHDDIGEIFYKSDIPEKNRKNLSKKMPYSWKIIQGCEVQSQNKDSLSCARLSVLLCKSKKKNLPYLEFFLEQFRPWEGWEHKSLHKEDINDPETICLDSCSIWANNTSPFVFFALVKTYEILVRGFKFAYEDKEKIIHNIKTKKHGSITKCCFVTNMSNNILACLKEDGKIICFNLDDIESPFFLRTNYTPIKITTSEDGKMLIVTTKNDDTYALEIFS